MGIKHSRAEGFQEREDKLQEVSFTKEARFLTLFLADGIFNGQPQGLIFPRISLIPSSQLSPSSWFPHLFINTAKPSIFLRSTKQCKVWCLILTPWKRSSWLTVIGCDNTPVLGNWQWSLLSGPILSLWPRRHWANYRCSIFSRWLSMKYNSEPGVILSEEMAQSWGIISPS